MVLVSNDASATLWFLSTEMEMWRNQTLVSRRDQGTELWSSVLGHEMRLSLMLRCLWLVWPKHYNRLPSFAVS